MPASRRTCNPIRRDEAVSEVIGQILMFGILSMVLVLSLMSFNIAKERTEERVIETTAQSIAQRVASLTIETALFAEKFEEQAVALQSRLELPQRLEGREYTIEVTGAVVTIVAGDVTASSPLFAAGSEGLVHVCQQTALEGGDIIIRITDTHPDVPTVTVGCDTPAVTPQFYVYLEKAA